MSGQCTNPNNCRKCSLDSDIRRYYLLHDAFILKPSAKNENAVVASRNLRIEKVKAASNRSRLQEFLIPPLESKS